MGSMKALKVVGMGQTNSNLHRDALTNQAASRAPQDGTSKMSKSAELDSSRINLLDDAATIVKKVKGAKTDTLEGLEWDNPERPEARNLLAIYQLATGMSMVRRKLTIPAGSLSKSTARHCTSYAERSGKGRDRCSVEAALVCGLRSSTSWPTGHKRPCACRSR